MAKKIIKVEDTKKSKVDLNKINDDIIDNKDTIAKIVDFAGDLLDGDDVKKKTNSSTKKSSGKSNTKKKKKTSNSNDLSTVIDIAGKLLK